MLRVPGASKAHLEGLCARVSRASWGPSSTISLDVCLSGADLGGPASSDCVRPGLPDKKPIVESCQAWVCTLLQLALSGMGPELVSQTEEMLISKVLCLFSNHKLVEVEET